MDRFPRLAVVLLGTVVTVSACTGMCGQSPSPAAQRSTAATPRPAPVPLGPPNVFALVLDVQPDAVKVISVKPSHGTIIVPTRVELEDPAGARDRLMIEYSVQSNASSSVLQSGTFWVSQTAFVEEDGREPTGGSIHVRRRVVTVAVPITSEPASILFDRVDAVDSTPLERWPRTRVGAALLQAVSR